MGRLWAITCWHSPEICAAAQADQTYPDHDKIYFVHPVFHKTVEALNFLLLACSLTALCPAYTLKTVALDRAKLAVMLIFKAASRFKTFDQF